MITMLTTHLLSLLSGDDTLFGLANSTIAEAKKTLGGAGFLVVFGWFVFHVAKKGFAAGAIVIAAVVGGLCLWIMTDGMTDMQNRIDKQFGGIHEIAPVPADHLGGMSRGGA